MSHLYTFTGGIRLPVQRETALAHPVATMPLPAQLVFPLQTRRGQAMRTLVHPGDTVAQGEILAVSDDTADVPLLASAAGVVHSVDGNLVLHTQPDTAGSVALDDDADQIRQLKRLGVQGMGGATFPSYQKLEGATAIDTPIDTLIINAAECEPLICCDQALIRESADEIVSGIALLSKLSNSRRCLIGIEDSMSTEIQLLREALQQRPGNNIELRVIPTIYPTGSERQLIRVLTGKTVGAHELPREHAVLCFNIATACAVKRALLDGQALLERIITISGSAVEQPRNVCARFGTRFDDLLRWLGLRELAGDEVIMGGPMSGVASAVHSSSVSAATNCLLIERPRRQQTLPCIRCGECDKVCPARLLPQQLHWFCRADDLQNAEKFHLSSCLECGCCDYVCPSNIALTPQFRQARQDAREAQRIAALAARSQQRHQAREERLARKEQQRQRKLQQRKEALEKKRAAQASPGQSKGPTSRAGPGAGV